MEKIAIKCIRKNAEVLRYAVAGLRILTGEHIFSRVLCGDVTMLRLHIKCHIFNSHLCAATPNKPEFDRFKESLSKPLFFGNRGFERIDS